MESDLFHSLKYDCEEEEEEEGRVVQDGFHPVTASMRSEQRGEGNLCQTQRTHTHESDRWFHSTLSFPSHKTG